MEYFINLLRNNNAKKNALLNKIFVNCKNGIL